MTTQINVKRVYEPPDAADGRRILVERLWPRGVRRESIDLDRWAKELGASDALRRWYDHVPDRWSEFKRRYRAELRQHPENWESLVELARSEPVTLLFSARDENATMPLHWPPFLLRVLESEKDE